MVVGRITLDSSRLSECIGKGEGPWGILLDGSHECEGMEQQRGIIRFINQFIPSFAGVPFVWSISSRPKPHIVAAFTTFQAIEYVPGGTTEGRKDTQMTASEPTPTHFRELVKGIAVLEAPQ